MNDAIRALIAEMRARGVPVLGPWASLYSPVEEKLIRLALDCAAQPGEVENSAVKLIESLRRRGIRPEAIICGSELPRPASRPAFDCSSVRMPWGIHEGKRLRNIPFDYLRFILKKCTKADPLLLRTIRLYLRQVTGS
jgi:hypothetical protein